MLPRHQTCEETDLNAKISNAPIPGDKKILQEILPIMAEIESEAHRGQRPRSTGLDC